MAAQNKGGREHHAHKCRLSNKNEPISLGHLSLRNAGRKGDESPKLQ
jgi:hypothetical protein